MSMNRFLNRIVFVLSLGFVLIVMTSFILNMISDSSFDELNATRIEESKFQDAIRLFESYMRRPNERKYESLIKVFGSWSYVKGEENELTIKEIELIEEIVDSLDYLNEYLVENGEFPANADDISVDIRIKYESMLAKFKKIVNGEEELLRRIRRIVVYGQITVVFVGVIAITIFTGKIKKRVGKTVSQLIESLDEIQQGLYGRYIALDNSDISEVAYLKNAINELNHSQENLVEELKAKIENLGEKEAEIVELNHSLEKAFFETIELLNNTVEAKDYETGNHAERITRYALAIGRELRLPQNKLRTLEMACKVHDIGKVAIPEYILSKKKLTDEEYRIIQGHSQNGYNIFRNIKSMQEIAIIVLYHHERYDGNGYPTRIGGEEIPLLSRILTLADSFDAMISYRVYKEHMNVEDAIKEVIECSGTQFDPMIVRTFHQLYINKKLPVYKVEEVSDKGNYYYLIHDRLTDCMNRNYLELFKKEKKEKDGQVGIIFIDVNGLKLMNDAFGHADGDLLIKAIAKKINQVFDNCIVIRWGGDEFIVILEGENIEKYKNTELEFDDVVVRGVHASCAIGYRVGHMDYFDNVMILAEKEMYSHKMENNNYIRNNMVREIIDVFFTNHPNQLEHGKRVKSYALKLGDSLSISKEELESLGFAALYHDIGKIGLEFFSYEMDYNEEDNNLQDHPEIGYRILNYSTEFTRLSSYVLSHHEKWNGKGFPNGLVMEAIPLTSRIIMISDFYDHIRMKVNNNEMDHKTMIENIKEEKGVSLDPYLVELFLKIEQFL